VVLLQELLLPDFLFRILKANKETLVRLAGGGAQPNISQKIIRDIQIPLPPLEVQNEIVAEVELNDWTKAMAERAGPELAAEIEIHLR